MFPSNMPASIFNNVVPANASVAETVNVESSFPPAIVTAAASSIPSVSFALPPRVTSVPAETVKLIFSKLSISLVSMKPVVVVRFNVSFQHHRLCHIDSTSYRNSCCVVFGGQSKVIRQQKNLLLRCSSICCSAVKVTSPL